MLLYRICKKKHAALDGEGAFRVGGRWNPAGTRMVYTAGSISLAVCECLVHFDLSEAPPNQVLITIDIPDDLAMDELTTRPRNWNRIPPVQRTKEIGREWLADRGNSAVLEVPSVVVPEDFNYLLNPRHPDFKRVRFSVKSFDFDERFFES